MCTPGELQIVLDEAYSGLRELFGEKLREMILYGSYARGDMDEESDVDVMALVDMPENELHRYWRTVNSMSVDIDLKHDVLLSVVLQDTMTFQQYVGVLPFFQNVLKDGRHYDGKQQS